MEKDWKEEESEVQWIEVFYFRTAQWMPFSWFRDVKCYILKSGGCVVMMNEYVYLGDSIIWCVNKLFVQYSWLYF